MWRVLWAAAMSWLNECERGAGSWRTQETLRCWLRSEPRCIPIPITPTPTALTRSLLFSSSSLSLTLCFLALPHSPVLLILALPHRLPPNRSILQTTTRLTRALPHPFRTTQAATSVFLFPLCVCARSHECKVVQRRSPRARLDAVFIPSIGCSIPPLKCQAVQHASSRVRVGAVFCPQVPARAVYCAQGLRSCCPSNEGGG